MDPRTATLTEFIRRYVEAVSQGASGEALAAFFHPDARQDEFPNRFVPEGQLGRDLKALLQSAELGKRAVHSQCYLLKSLLVQGEQAAVEVEWSGTLAVALGAIPAGRELRAHIAMFIELKDGRVFRQRNYDCYEPF